MSEKWFTIKYLLHRAVGRSENPGVPVVMWLAKSAPRGWDRPRVNWFAKTWVCHGTSGDDMLHTTCMRANLNIEYLCKSNSKMNEFISGLFYFYCIYLLGPFILSNQKYSEMLNNFGWWIRNFFIILTYVLST